MTYYNIQLWFHDPLYTNIIHIEVLNKKPPWDEVFYSFPEHFWRRNDMTDYAQQISVQSEPDMIYNLIPT